MPVTKIALEEDCKLVIAVTASEPPDAEAKAAIFDDLDRALEGLSEEINGDPFFYQITLDIEGYARKAGAFSPEETDPEEAEEHDPWVSFCPEFWTEALNDPNLRPRVAQFAERLQGILYSAAKTAHSAPSEFDEVQLGEPLMAHLAIADAAFIARYIGFYESWDMDHEVEISGAVAAIIAAHGACPEVDALLASVLINQRSGGDAEHLYLEAFADAYDAPAQSVLFRRYVVTLYCDQMHFQIDAYRSYQSRLAREGDAVPVPGEQYACQFAENTTFGQVERQIIAELQSSQFQPPSGGGFLGGLFRN